LRDEVKLLRDEGREMKLLRVEGRGLRVENRFSQLSSVYLNSHQID